MPKVRGMGERRGKGQVKDKARPRSPTPGARTTKGTSPAGKKNAPPCHLYVAGKCDKGADCQYWHSPVCTLWQQGSCSEGKTCAFLHGEKPTMERTATPARKEEAEPKAKAKAKAKAKVGANMAFSPEALSCQRAGPSVLTFFPKACCENVCCTMPSGVNSQEDNRKN